MRTTSWDYRNTAIRQMLKAEGIESEQDALRHLRSAPASDDRAVAVALTSVAKWHIAKDALSEAQEYLDRAEAVFKKAQCRHYEMYEVKYLQAESCARRGLPDKEDDVIDAFLRSVELEEGENSSIYAAFLTGFARIADCEDKCERAKSLYEQALVIYKKRRNRARYTDLHTEYLHILDRIRPGSGWNLIQQEKKKLAAHAESSPNCEYCGARAKTRRKIDWFGSQMYVCDRCSSNVKIDHGIIEALQEASSLRSAGKVEKALGVCDCALEEIFRLPRGHRKYWLRREALGMKADILVQSGNARDAVPIYRLLVRRSKTVFSLLVNYWSYAGVLMGSGSPKRAWSVLHKAIDVALESGPGHIDTASMILTRACEFGEKARPALPSPAFVETLRQLLQTEGLEMAINAQRPTWDMFCQDVSRYQQARRTSNQPKTRRRKHSSSGAKGKTGPVS